VIIVSVAVTSGCCVPVNFPAFTKVSSVGNASELTGSSRAAGSMQATRKAFTAFLNPCARNRRAARRYRKGFVGRHDELVSPIPAAGERLRTRVIVAERVAIAIAVGTLMKALARQPLDAECMRSGGVVPVGSEPEWR